MTHCGRFTAKPQRQANCGLENQLQNIIHAINTSANISTRHAHNTQTFIDADIKQLPRCTECGDDQPELLDLTKCWNSEAAGHLRVCVELAVFQHSWMDRLSPTMTINDSQWHRLWMLSVRHVSIDVVFYVQICCTAIITPKWTHLVFLLTLDNRTQSTVTGQPLFLLWVRSSFSSGFQSSTPSTVLCLLQCHSNVILCLPLNFHTLSH